MVDKKKKKTRTKKKKKKWLKTILIILLFIISIGFMVYPFISNFIFENRADGIIETVEKEAENADKEEYKKKIEEAEAYNQILANGKIIMTDPFDADEEAKNQKEYNSLLNMTDEGVMGFIQIPCINVSLPIYHGTSASVLEKGAGHLQGSSLPVGGPNTHSIITGHTGLSSAKLFTDLTALEKGDYFFLYVMGEKLAYRVIDISVVLPSEMDRLTIQKGKDYCTLVTCTPYGVNSHRLLVKGERTEYTEAVKKPQNLETKATTSKWQEEYTKSIIVASLIFIVMMLVLIIYRESKNKKRKKKKRHTTRRKADAKTTKTHCH